MVQLLEQNHDVSAFMQGLLEHLVEWCQQAGVEFKDVRLHQPFVNSDGFVVFHITVAGRDGT